MRRGAWGVWPASRSVGPALTTAAATYHPDPPHTSLAALIAVDPNDPSAADTYRRHLGDLPAATGPDTPLDRNLRRLAAGVRTTAINPDPTGYAALTAAGGVALADDDMEAGSAVVKPNHAQPRLMWSRANRRKHHDR